MDNKLIDICTKKINKEVNDSWTDIAIKYNVYDGNGENLRCAFKKWRKKNGQLNSDIKQIHKDLNDKDLENNNRQTIEINKDGTQSSDKLLLMSEEQAKDIDYLLKAHGYDLKVWELVSARNNIWNVYSKQDGIQTLYSSKIIVKPRKDTISIEELEEHFKEFSEKYKSPINKNYKFISSNKMFEIPVMDLHLGKLGWEKEVGENYDYRIAETRFLKVINDFINRTKHYNFDKIIFPIGNDWFNFDTIEGTTTHGTKQDNDLRWQKLFLKGIELLIKAIDMLSEVAPVEIFYVSGNHDKTTSYYATNYIYAWYRNSKNITVSIEPQTRKYIEFGNCLIGYAHGDTEKKRIDGIMQVEARESWGRTKFHEWHLGHLHSEQTKEENGIIIRNISSITGSDAWHIESGYVGAIRKAQAFVWDKEIGLTDILNSVIM
jgi:predicted phosphodiesterase